MIGVGGLGHVAVQILRAISAVRIIAVDVGQDQLDLAKRYGADITLESGPDTAQHILDLNVGQRRRSHLRLRRYRRNCTDVCSGGWRRTARIAW